MTDLPCEDCGNPAELNRVRCAVCLEKRRVIEARIRARNGQTPGTPGRPRKNNPSASALRSRAYEEKRRAAKPAGALASKRVCGARLTSDTLKMVNRLPSAKRDRVDAIVRAHVQACQRNGFLPENLERVFIEAVELVDIEERFPEPTEEKRPYEPFRQYQQYVSPTAV
jgi:hypothetical protein